MNDLFTADFFIGNRRKLQRDFVAKHGDIPFVITANGQMQMSGDVAYAFHQDTHFWYLTGLSQPDLLLVMDGDEEYLLVPARELVREAFDGAIDNDELVHLSGIQKVYELETGWKRLSKRLKSVSKVAGFEPLPAYLEHYDMYTNPARKALLVKIKAVNSDIELINLRQDVARQRMVKQAPEIKATRRAIDITIDSIIDAVGQHKLTDYSYEYELAAAISYGFRKRGSKVESFDTMVACGKNATTIHNMNNNGPIKPGELAMLDVGATYQNYCADISRTYSIGGRPSSRQQAIYEAVLDVQQYAFGLIKPGMQMRDYEQSVETYLGEKLVALKIIKIAEKSAIRRYYPHACSHFLGLDAHDAGDYEAALPAGVMLAVEPGIYVPEEGIGVRIEDNVIITDDGCEILTDRLPKTLM